MLTEDSRARLLRRLNGEMRLRLLTVPRRPETFDVLKGTPEELDFYGLPAQPDKKDELAFELWKGLVTTAAVPLEQWFAILPLPLLDYRIIFNQMIGGTHQETSKNWSGAVTQAAAGLPFQQVLARWQIPNIGLPSGAANGVEYRCSTWIGLDGAVPTSWSMPQIGTTQSVVLKNGAPQYTFEAWFQWWMRIQPNPPVKIASIDLAPGDVVHCALQVQGPNVVNMSIANTTKNQSYTASVVAPAITIPLPSMPPYNLSAAVEGKTAEWVAERPTKLDSTELYPLPDFDRVTFEGALAQTGTPVIARGMSPGRLVRMTERHQGQTIVLSRARQDASDPDHKLYVGPGLEADMVS